MAQLQGHDDAWIERQLARYRTLASGYILISQKSPVGEP
jgi:hypothetical protein